MDQAKIGSLLKELRNEKNLTQEQLAEKFIISSRTVSRWENGKNLPDISLLIELADFYKVDIRELLDGERKSENMNNEVKEVLTKVSDYTDSEKESILKSLLFGITGTMIIFFALIMLNAFHIDENYGIISLLYYLMPAIGLLFSGIGVIRFLQIKGNMSKNRLNKVKSFLIPISIVLFSIVFIHCISMVKWFISYNTTNINEYDKQKILKTFGNDIDSNLSIFPNSLSEDAFVSLFEVDFEQGLFDTDGELILSCKYNDADFVNEINRLSAIKMTITDKSSGESYTNAIIIDKDSYMLPAYITNTGFGNTYEYALIDKDSKEITYLYLAYPNPEKFDYPQYLLKDSSLYNEENTLNSFSMYNHSFDGGNSYIEFDE